MLAELLTPEQITILTQIIFIDLVLAGDNAIIIGMVASKFPPDHILKISKTDSFKQYVAYHEGWGNYKYYKKNKKIINLAKRVERQSNLYKKQLLECQSKFNKNKYIIF